MAEPGDAAAPSSQVDADNLPMLKLKSGTQQSPNGENSQTQTAPSNAPSLADTDPNKPANDRTGKLFFAALCGMFLVQSASGAGYTSSVVSAIETRYGLSNTQVAIILSFGDVGGLIATIPISYIGGSAASRIGHRPYWIGTAGLVSAFALMVWALPHFISGSYIPNKSASSLNGTEYCSKLYLSNSTTCSVQGGDSSSTSDNSVYLAILVIGNIIGGLCGSAAGSLGVPYMQDGFSPTSFALYLGVLYSMTAIGPVIGFGVGAACQSLFVDIKSSDSEEPSVRLLTPESPAWVGAWWLGYVIFAVLYVLISIPFFFFPRSLGKRSSRPTPVNAEQQVTNLDAKDDEGDEDDDLVFPSVKEAPRELARIAWSMIKNPVWMLACFIYISLTSPITGFVSYLKKYIEIMFGYPASTSSLLMGGVLVPACALGVMLGGFINQRFGKAFSRMAVRLFFYVAFVLVCLGIMIMVRCPSSSVVGIHMNYFGRPKNTALLSPVGDITSNPNPVGLWAPCNANCLCNSFHHDPVCGSDGFTYFSACYAGCTKAINNSKAFTSCSCIANSTASQWENDNRGPNSRDSAYPFMAFGSATLGTCFNCVAATAIFLAASFAATITISFAHNSNMLMLLKSVPRSRRSLSMGLFGVTSTLFGGFPAPLVFGRVVDSACIYAPSASCSGSLGSSSAAATYCMLYDPDHLATALFGLAYGYVGLAMVLIVVLIGYLHRDQWRTFLRKCVPAPNVTTVTPTSI